MGSPPSTFLERMLQHHVTLELKDRRQLSGKLVGCDEHMNLVLEDTEERTAEMTRRLGKVVLRGSNVISLHVPETGPGRTG